MLLICPSPRPRFLRGAFATTPEANASCDSITDEDDGAGCSGGGSSSGGARCPDAIASFEARWVGAGGGELCSGAAVAK